MQERVSPVRLSGERGDEGYAHWREVLRIGNTFDQLSKTAIVEMDGKSTAVT